MSAARHAGYGLLPTRPGGQAAWRPDEPPGVAADSTTKRISIAQLLLAWVIRNDGVIAIPKASSIAHVKDNAAALGITFNSDELALINQAFPPPTVRVPLDAV